MEIDKILDYTARAVLKRKMPKDLKKDGVEVEIKKPEVILVTSLSVTFLKTMDTSGQSNSPLSSNQIFIDLPIQDNICCLEYKSANLEV